MYNEACDYVYELIVYVLCVLVSLAEVFPGPWRAVAINAHRLTRYAELYDH